MINMGICQPSQSAWASPLHLVPKKDGSWRPCGDYRALNNITKPDRYPIPHLQDFNSHLVCKRIFSKIDLIRAYYHIPVDPDDIPKTAVITPFGLFEFLRLPFGLRNAAQTFERYIDSIFRDLDSVYCYVDDILVASETEEDHKKHLHLLLQRLSDFNINTNLSKCLFGATVVPFLGYLISKDGIRPLPQRVETIRNYPLPITVTDLRRFLGLINFYRRALPDAANKQAPLSDLIRGTKKNNKRKII
jgi:hypothetical protein